ncbi:hypothetical protein CEXT_282851 [Caerostris extrusa]|uniref:Uncharacterized protein n=1 Tax=Caerostris extrusa TaxID=172846 RepID=A0AAV4XNR7_CAEEX|nr:hypothetical protein CEXT_282851 [Caerostris extrusa]
MSFPFPAVTVSADTALSMLFDRRPDVGWMDFHNNLPQFVWGHLDLKGYSMCDFINNCEKRVMFLDFGY